MSTEVGKAAAQNLMQVIEKTKPQEILELDLVKKRFIQNYNLCNPGNMGDVAYQRNVIFLRQRIAEDHNLAKADKMSLYKVIVTMGTKGVSIDPQDKEAYVYARGGKAVLELQAPAYVRRLLNAKSPFQQLREAANNSKWDEMRRLIKTHDFNRHLISAHFRSLKSDGMPSDIYHYLLDKHDSSLATM